MKMMKKSWLSFAVMMTIASPVVIKAQTSPTSNIHTAVAKPNAGLTVPNGFGAKIIADNLGKARHLIVTPQNDIYVRLARKVDGHGTLLLHEENDKASVVYGFGNFGGTGVYLRDSYLYTASNSEIFRYKLDAQNRVIDTVHPERIVTGLLDKGTHETKSITMDAEGNMYIPIGCPLNSCQQQDRKKGSMGIPGCPLLEISGGVWMFKRDKLDQTYDDGVRYATGLRNVVAVDWNYVSNKLFVVQHGRDQLHDIFPDIYTVQQNAELPAECMFALSKGSNAGWPYSYYDPFKNKKMLAPEYGGDGVKEASSEFLNPVKAYPGHFAPNDLLFYTGNQFPEKYRNGAFIAFHGSWNRAPEPQAGYCVVFQPFKNGLPVGDWEVFADGFSGSSEKTAAGRAEHRPCGLAQGPDGSLYVADDSKGTIYKITYNAKPVTKNPVIKPVVAKVTPKKPAPLKTVNDPGRNVYMQTCVSCHQVDGGGVPNLNPTLSKTSYVLGDKSQLVSVVLMGIHQKEIDGQTYSNAMPPFNYLTDKQIADVLTYIRKSFGNKASAVTVDDVKKARP